MANVSPEKEELDSSLCSICQQVTEETLVKNPVSQEKLLSRLEEWNSYEDSRFSEVWRRLGECSAEELLERNISWHRTCYQDATHLGKLKRAKDRYERSEDDSHLKRKRRSTPQKFTRSQTVPLNKETCFFCDQGANQRESLHKVSTSPTGEAIRSAVERSGDDRLQVKLSTAIDANDAHAIDIRYHNKCYTKNVTNVLRREPQDKCKKEGTLIAAQVEFLDVAEKMLQEGKPKAMAELECVYNNILEENAVEVPLSSRKVVKQLLSDKIWGIEFHKSPRVNESERVSIKETRDASILSMEEQLTTEVKTLYDAASLLRKRINTCKQWHFGGKLDDIDESQLPNELCCFFRWVIQGPKDFASDDKSSEVHKRARSLAQTTVSLTLTQRQVRNAKSEVIKIAREMPQQLAIGIAIHQAIRSKEIVNFLHGFGLSAEYNRILRVEAQIERNVLQRMERNGGIYLPPDVVLGRRVFFAADNVDFAEDTPDGKRTLHGTALAIYQKTHPEDVVPELSLGDDARNGERSVKDLPEVTLLDCPKPAKSPKCPTYPTFTLSSDEEISSTAKVKDVAWLTSRCVTRGPTRGPVDEEDGVEGDCPNPEVTSSHGTPVPVWSGYNSLIHQSQPVTRIGAPPLIAAPAHEWSTLLTVLMQAQGITAKVMGTGHKTVISLDMGLYQPAKKLLMARDDLKNIILRPGELHIVMAQLRTIGAFIENSGIDMSWVEADLYGPTTARQIIDGNHVKRGEAAHLLTLQALFSLYHRAFLEQQDTQLAAQIEENAKQLGEACLSGSKDDVTEASVKMEACINSLDVSNKMKAFNEENSHIPVFQVCHQYMRMVLEMMMFIRAVRTGNWKLHLSALELFTKYFFAHDRLNYARMIPLYLAEMQMLEVTAQDIYREFISGNWVVNKNPNVAFCAMGADNALEQINRSMKVSGGLVGITLNQAARTKFFLIAPELARLAEEAKEMAGTTAKEGTHHHTLTPSALSREEKNVEKLTATIESFTNPFDVDSVDLFNLVTKVVVPESVKTDLLEQSSIGQKLFESFVNDRIKSQTISVWSPMKKRQLKTWKSVSHKVKVVVGKETVELKEDRNLFARMLVVCKRRPEIDVEEAVGTYEFSVVPRAMFATDGSMLHCSAKSALMPLLERLAVCPDERIEQGPVEEDELRVAIIDGMAEVQSLDKPEWIRNCSQLADHFTCRIFEKYGRSNDEIRLLFDRYDLPSSLKEATRVKRQGNEAPIHYRITSSTLIAKVTMKKLLSHSDTKKELAEYFAKRTIEKAEERGHRVVIAWGCECKGTKEDKSYLSSNQEEADTKIILHAVDATSSGATEIRIHSPDTDVFILALRRFPELCPNTVFVTGKGEHHRTIKLQPIVRALGPVKTAALPAFHALTGADNTGAFAGKGKPKCWAVFKEASDDVLSALSCLGTSDRPSVQTGEAVEKLVCQFFLPGTEIGNVRQLRWWLFRKKQAKSERLPPTFAALKQAILRSHYQLLVWNSDKVANPELPSPDGYGWTWQENTKMWVPVMTTLSPAPDAIIHLVKCNCVKERCANNRCQCRKSGLNCTDLCGCSDTGDECANTTRDPEPDDEESAVDSDDPETELD